jgi:hypothetical protein
MYVAGMSQATPLDSLSVGYTIRLYAVMIGYGYEYSSSECYHGAVDYLAGANPGIEILGVEFL